MALHSKGGFFKSPDAFKQAITIIGNSTSLLMSIEPFFVIANGTFSNYLSLGGGAECDYYNKVVKVNDKRVKVNDLDLSTIF